MDFFNINWASLQNKIYADLKLFYSPFNLVIGKNLVSSECLNSSSGIELQACNTSVALLFFLIAYIINIILIYKILSGAENQFLWTMIMGLSFPMMYGIERGNYIQLCMLFISMYILFENRLIKNILISCAILIKSYLIVFLFTYYIFKKYYDILYIFVIIMVISIISGLLIGDSQWYLIPKNIMSFSSDKSDWYQLFYNTTNFSPFREFSRNLYGGIFVILTMSLCFFFYIIIRILIYVTEIKSTIKYYIHFDYILLVSLVALLILTNTPKYYALILIMPLFAQSLKAQSLSVSSELYFIFILIPYPLVFESTSLREGAPFFLINLQTLVLPFLLFLLFLDLTKYQLSFRDQNEKN